MQHYRLEISPKPACPDPQGHAVLDQIRNFLHLAVEDVRTRQVYSLYNVKCTKAQAQEILEAFRNRVIEDGVIGESKPAFAFDWFIQVGFKPGVTDNVARSARSAISDVLGRHLADSEEMYGSTEYFVIAPKLDRTGAERIARGLLANTLIQNVTILAAKEWKKTGAPENRPIFLDKSKPEVKIIDLEVSDARLMEISRAGILALSLDEMKVIQAYFRKQAKVRKKIGLPAAPTDVELEVLAQTWSEHCKHKIFAATIDYTDEKGKKQEIKSCFKTFIRKSTEEIGKKVPWLVSVFHDNAGVIKFNDKFHIVYKAETHNSPTALDPYGGSMTGIVGVNRDPMGTGIGANLLLNAWGYCFADPFIDPATVPAGLFHPRRLRNQVHKGVIDGGNQSGIPYITGWEYFDERYLGKPLVYCGTIGTLPVLVNGQPSEKKSIKPGDFAVMIGGRIGKDGIHGATFSSEELHKDSPVQAVQIGDPITQKLVYDFLMEARDLGLYRFITDNGAGGLSSSIGEMSGLCGGCELDLAKAPLKYGGLQPWEILVSEAQERMSLAIQPEQLQAFLKLAKRRDVEATVLGNFTDNGKFLIKFAGKTVCCLDMEFMHDGLPPMRLQAKWTPPKHKEPKLPAEKQAGKLLLEMLGRLNICSNEYKCRQYDHEVKGLSVIKPFIGIARDVQSDATISMVEQLGKDGVILATGIAPRYSDIDTYHMMASVIDIAVRRTIAVGGSLGHIAGLDNFCWPDPVQSEKTPDGIYKCAQLVRCNQALYDYTKAYQVPCISGKDSMKNDSTLGGRKISIPPTVLFSTIARMDDISKAVTLDAKNAGDLVYVLGTTYSELGGSEFYNLLGATGNAVPQVRTKEALALYKKVSQATAKELCHSLHTPVFGGLGVAFAKVAIAGRLGLDIDLDQILTDSDLPTLALLFSESNSRFVATISPKDKAKFEKLMADMPCALVGKVTADPNLTLRRGTALVAKIKVADAVKAYKTTLDNV